VLIRLLRRCAPTLIAAIVFLGLGQFATAAIMLAQSSAGPPGSTVSTPIGDPSSTIFRDIDERAWTSSHIDLGVSVLASLYSLTDARGTAFLTTKIGPGTTPADVVASTPFTFPVYGSDAAGIAGSIASPTQLFNGLNLTPGTYHLVLAPVGTDQGFWTTYIAGSIATAPWVTAATSIDFSNFTTGGQDFAFPPDSNFGINTNIAYGFTVTALESIPEPAAMALAMLGSICLLPTLYHGSRRRNAAP
jgi:hypothetical protein